MRITLSKGHLCSHSLHTYCSVLILNLSCRFKDHPTLNDRYLLLHLLGRGGFSEVFKVSGRHCSLASAFLIVKDAVKVSKSFPRLLI